MILATVPHYLLHRRMCRDNGNEPDESSSQVSNETSETAVETKLSDVLGFEFPAANRSFNILYAEGYMEPDFCVDLFDI